MLPRPLVLLSFLSGVGQLDFMSCDQTELNVHDVLLLMESRITHDYTLSWIMYNTILEFPGDSDHLLLCS